MRLRGVPDGRGGEWNPSRRHRTCIPPRVARVISRSAWRYRVLVVGADLQQEIAVALSRWSCRWGSPPSAEARRLVGREPEPVIEQRRTRRPVIVRPSGNHRTEHARVAGGAARPASGGVPPVVKRARSLISGRGRRARCWIAAVTSRATYRRHLGRGQDALLMRAFEGVRRRRRRHRPRFAERGQQRRSGSDGDRSGGRTTQQVATTHARCCRLATHAVLLGSQIAATGASSSSVASTWALTSLPLRARQRAERRPRAVRSGGTYGRAAGTHRSQCSVAARSG